jgi:[acyl-carrier-protein] S-malonyltransferase
MRSPAAAEHVAALAKERGAGHIVSLNVRAPFHCHLMEPLRNEVADILGKYA